MIYFILVGLFLGLSMITRGDHRFFAALLTVSLIAVVGSLRFEVGTDWSAYEELFDLIGRGENFSDLREENGFLLLLTAVHALTGSYSALIFILFLLSFSLKLYAIVKFNADIIVSSIVYFYSVFLIYDLNGLRQGLAMGFVLCSGWFAVRRKPGLFLLAVTTAVSVHAVAIVALPIYWLTDSAWITRCSRSIRYLIGISAIAIGSVLSTLIGSTDASAYLELINLSSRYNHYIENFQTEFSIISLATMQRVIILSLIIYMHERLKCSDLTKSLLINCCFVSTFVFFALSFNIEFMARVSFYYKVFEIITLSLISKSLKGPVEVLCFWLLLVALALGSVYQILSIPDGGLSRYNSLLLR